LFAVLVGWYQGDARLYWSILLAEKTLRLSIAAKGLHKACALFRIRFCFGQGSMLLPAEEAALVLRDGLSATSQMWLSSESFLLLLLLICSSFGDKKGVLKVNRAEERGGVRNQMLELNQGVFGTFFATKTKTKPKKPGKDNGSDWFLSKSTKKQSRDHKIEKQNWPIVLSWHYFKCNQLYTS
jgi:hypothetical protein